MTFYECCYSDTYSLTQVADACFNTIFLHLQNQRPTKVVII